MAKRQKLSFCQLDELPDEVILKIVGFLDLKELLLCGHVSKRLQAITNDESLWLKLNMRGRFISYDFIEKVIGNGCQYLSLPNCDIMFDDDDTAKHFTGKSPFNLKYLNLSNELLSGPGGFNNTGVELLQNCCSLQKLSLASLYLDLKDIPYIWKSGQTLQVLDLGHIWTDHYNETFKTEVTKLYQDLFSNCPHLTELYICDNNLLDSQIQALVDNLTPTILKVSLERQGNLQDEHVKKLVKRCNNITHLDLSSTSITNNSVHSIIGQLKASLEKLKVSGTEVDLATLLELKSMPTLKTLIVDSFVDLHKEIENLEQQLPHISINKEMECDIAKPFSAENGSDLFVNTDRIWEIRAKEQNLFAEVEGYSDSIGLI